MNKVKKHVCCTVKCWIVCILVIFVSGGRTRHVVQYILYLLLNQQCLFNVGRPFTTLDQRYTSVAFAATPRCDMRTHLLLEEKTLLHNCTQNECVQTWTTSAQSWPNYVVSPTLNWRSPGVFLIPFVKNDPDTVLILRQCTMPHETFTQ